MARLTLEQVVQAVNEIPPLPTVATRVFHLLRDPKISAKAIADEICLDQALAAQVLKLANSAYYSYSRRVSTVAEAVVILGMNTIRNMVLAASVAPTLDKPLEGYFMEKGMLWQHSIAVAMGAQIIAKQKHRVHADNAFIAGLLHDIGKLVLDYHMRETYSQIIERVNTERVPFLEAEREVLGFDHSQVGGRVAERWNLPVELVETIIFHHDPMKAEKNPLLCAMVHVADMTAMMMGIGLGGDGLLYPLSVEALELLKMGPEDVEGLASELADVLTTIPELA